MATVKAGIFHLLAARMDGYRLPEKYPNMGRALIDSEGRLVVTNGWTLFRVPLVPAIGENGQRIINADTLRQRATDGFESDDDFDVSLSAGCLTLAASGLEFTFPAPLMSGQTFPVVSEKVLPVLGRRPTVRLTIKVVRDFLKALDRAGASYIELHITGEGEPVRCTVQNEDDETLPIDAVIMPARPRATSTDNQEVAMEGEHEGAVEQETPAVPDPPVPSDQGDGAGSSEEKSADDGA